MSRVDEMAIEGAHTMPWPHWYRQAGDQPPCADASTRIRLIEFNADGSLLRITYFDGSSQDDFQQADHA